MTVNQILFLNEQTQFRSIHRIVYVDGQQSFFNTTKAFTLPLLFLSSEKRDRVEYIWI